MILSGVLLSSAASIAAQPAHAQIPNSISGVDLNMTPETPQPGETITIELQSYITDLSGAQIVWYVDEKSVAEASGTGKTKYILKAPKNGVRLSVSASITTIEGRRVQKSIDIQPNAVDLVAETNGFIPALYPGKPLIAYQNTVKIIAMPHLVGTDGSEINPKKLIYMWKRNSKVLQDQSGYGKQSIFITGNVVPRPYTIWLDVSSIDGKIHGASNISFEESDPSLAFYEDDPLYGTLYNKMIGDRFQLKNKELNVLAVPYGFNANDLESTTFVWSINSDEQPDLGNKRSVTLRVKEGASGSSGISLETRNQQSILQGASAAFTAYFNPKKISNSAYGGSDTFNNPF
ncbi:MAG: seg [Candidatus Taylorbacteria bacterium]|nr:seg [Candidatus Taylorbacteria bacterium]